MICCVIGYLLDDLTGRGCIANNQCPCIQNGIIYKPGQTYRSNCKEWWIYILCICCTSSQPSVFCILLLNPFRIGMFLFVLVCVMPPTANLPIRFPTNRVASWWKRQCITAMDGRKLTGSEIVDSIRSKNLSIHHKSSLTQRNIKMRINTCVWEMETLKPRKTLKQNADLVNFVLIDKHWASANVSYVNDDNKISDYCTCILIMWL